MCEFRLGRSPARDPVDSTGAEANAIPGAQTSLENLIAGLQELAKSVERHTRSGGRQGYLRFIDKYLP